MRDMSGQVQLVCSRCSQPDSRYFEMPPDWFVGRLVKIAFEEDGRVENMWVEVTGIRGDTLVGFLDNHPIWMTGVQYGDTVELKRTQIKAAKLPQDPVAPTACAACRRCVERPGVVVPPSYEEVMARLGC